MFSLQVLKSDKEKQEVALQDRLIKILEKHSKEQQDLGKE